MSHPSVPPVSSFSPHVVLQELRTERARRLRGLMSPERWEQVVQAARWRVQIVQEVEKVRGGGHGARTARLRELAPGTPWPTYCYWRRCVGTRQGPEWERLLDGRAPIPAQPVPGAVKSAAALARRMQPMITCQETRRLLVAQFGAEGKVSDATLHRVWRANGVNNPEMGDPARFERVVRYSGGAALALIGAAAAESGVPGVLARAALAAGRARVAEQDEGERLAVDPHPGRSEEGRFTGNYNQAVRQGVEAGQRDSRWDSDATKRERRDLGSLPILTLSPQVLGQRLLTMGMVPLVSSQRGFDGMDAPRARWIRMLGWPAYRPSTLDKTLGQLGILGVDAGLWEAHGRLWARKAREWAPEGTGWLHIARYLDITADPYWTGQFAKSGKVSRTGRVQPCLQRATLTAGPGVPLSMESVAGTQSLKKVLRDLLSEELAEAALGAPKEAPEWITVVDAEAAVPGLLKELTTLPRHRFVTVLKGSALKGATVHRASLWVPYRKRDRLCEVAVQLSSGLALRGVWMERSGSRHPHRTLFVTDASTEDLSTVDVADIYLSRWPHQESVFRNARRGAGLDRSHGFTGQYVTHLALEKKQEQANRRVERLQAAVHDAKVHALDALVLDFKEEDPVFGQVTAETARQAARNVDETEKRYRRAVEDKRRQDSMPQEIFVRDTTRENVATALNMSVMMLVEWVLREYLGGARMELETFLAYFLYLPVEVRTSWHKVRHRIDIGNLSSRQADLLGKACQEINRRRIRRDGRRLVFEILEPPDEID